MAAARKRRKNVAQARRRIGVGRWFHGGVGMSRAVAVAVQVAIEVLPMRFRFASRRERRESLQDRGAESIGSL